MSKKNKRIRHIFVTGATEHYMGGTTTTPRYTIHVGEYSIIEDLNLNELFCLRQLLNEVYDHQRTQHFLWKEHCGKQKGGTK